MFISIGQAANVIGVCVGTLRRWEQEKRFLPCFRTAGGHRRYRLSKIKKYFLHETLDERSPQNKHTIAYARVSSHDQKLDLKRQEKRLAVYCEAKKWHYEVISDLGSGLNYKKRGLNRLIRLICQAQIERLVLTHRDRLLRFGSPLLFKLCEQFGVEVVMLEKSQTHDFERELVADVIEIMTVFTAKMYGKRSHGNKRKLAAS